MLLNAHARYIRAKQNPIPYIQMKQNEQKRDQAGRWSYCFDKPSKEGPSA